MTMTSRARAATRGGTSFESLISVTLVALAGLGGLSGLGGLGALGHGIGRAIGEDGRGAAARGSTGATMMVVARQAGMDAFGHGAEVARATGLVPALHGVVDEGRAVAEVAEASAASAAKHLETLTLRGGGASDGFLAKDVSRRAVNALRYAVGERALPALERALRGGDILDLAQVDRFEAVIRPWQMNRPQFDLLGYEAGANTAVFRGGPYRTIFGNDAVGVVAHNGAPIHVRFPRPEGRAVGAELRRLTSELRPADPQNNIALTLRFKRTAPGKFEFTAGQLQSPIDGDISLAP